MPGTKDIGRYLIIAFLSIAFGVAVGYTISGEFGFPYWTVVPIFITIFLSIGLKLVPQRNNGNSVTVKNNDNVENEDKSNKDSTEDGENSEPGTLVDANVMEKSQIEENTPERGGQKSSKYSVGKSHEEILEEQVDRISDLVTVLEGDIIRIDNKYEPDPYRKMLLYVIAARYSFEEGYRDSPAVSSKELKSYFNYENTDIDILVRRLPSALSPHTGLGFPDYEDLDEFSFSVEVSNLERAIDWVLDDEDPRGLDTRLYFGFANMCLENAREYCEEIKQSEKEKFQSPPSNAYSGIEYEIKESIHDVRDYPIFNEDDTVWRDFMRTADTALRNVQKNSVGGILHCVDRMEGRLNILKSRHENSTENRLS